MVKPRDDDVLDPVNKSRDVEWLGESRDVVARRTAALYFLTIRMTIIGQGKLPADRCTGRAFDMDYPNTNNHREFLLCEHL